MITLKKHCTALNFKNMEKTQGNFTLLMYGAIEKERIDEEIQNYNELVKGGHDTTNYSKDQLDYLKRLQADTNYQNGSYPRGIEKIILQVMESYTFWHSINEVDSKFILTQDNYIHNLINVSLTFMVSCELAKLFNNDPEDFSLSNIWKYNAESIKDSNISSKDEIDYITDQFLRNESTRNQSIKRFLDFRNKSVAHNSKNTGLQWSDFVNTMNFILRVWGIIDEFYCPECLPRPIQISDQLYKPLQPHYTQPQIEKVKQARLKLMKDMFAAASTNLLTGANDYIKPFGELKVTVKIDSITTVDK